MSTLTSSLSLGRLAYWTFFYPKGIVLQNLQRDPIRRALDQKAQQQMEAATYELPYLSLPPGDPADIYFLTGQRYWYQTCFCAYSMQLHSDRLLRPVIYDDGSLLPHHIGAMQRLFPHLVLVTRPEIEAQLDHLLPISQFPTLRRRRLEYPHLRKLTDIHVGSQGWKLVLDSDMLFFRRPSLLLDWLAHPQTPCHMFDVQNAYGYSPALMQSLVGSPIPDRVNVGVCGLQSEALDWEELEFWCRMLIEREGTNYYQEQALVAMLMARCSRTCAPAAAYQVLPTHQEATRPTAILHHYVATSKPWYFRYGWRHVVAALSSALPQEV